MSEQPKAIDLLEPAIVREVPPIFGDLPSDRVCTISSAISLKRIADALDRLTDPNTPVNVYGEGFSAAIQNSIERGLRGISVGY